jgi:hypothetical protein
MTRRRVRGKRRRRGTKATASSALARPGRPDRAGRPPAETLPDSIAIPIAGEDDEEETRVAPSELDALLPQAAVAVAQAASAREPPRLIVDSPQRVAARRARDQRDGVQVADPRRRGLYLGIAVFVAVVVLVFAVLSLIDSRDFMPSLLPAP